MRFDLIRPCKYCPFSTGADRIVFRGRARAEEIEEIAYRDGFVCHEHGDDFDDEESSYIDFRDDGSSQHCFGALYMYLRNGNGNIPWEQLTDAQHEKWWEHITLDQILQADTEVWADDEAFLNAHDPLK